MDKISETKIDEIPILKNTPKIEKFVSKGFQHFRDRILLAMHNLSFSEKFIFIKKIDKALLEIVNRHQGTKAVHTLNYYCKFPSRKKDLTIRDECYLTLRVLLTKLTLDHYNTDRKAEYDAKRRSEMIRVIK